MAKKLPKNKALGASLVRPNVVEVPKLKVKVAVRRRPRSRIWGHIPNGVLQDDTGMCVGISGVQLLNAAPVRNNLTFTDAKKIWSRAKDLDTDPSTDSANPDHGTTLWGGFRAMRAFKMVPQEPVLAWTDVVEDILSYVSDEGPMWLAIPWYWDMFFPVNGRIEPTGELAGGHAVVVVGVAPDGVVLLNGWDTPDWLALGNKVKVSKTGLKKLLNIGYALAVRERKSKARLETDHRGAAPMQRVSRVVT